jgi:Tat protein translocase TatB subunit
MFGINPQELLVILVIALIVVGPRKLPEMARSIGRGLREVRKAQDEVRKTIQVDLDDEPPPSRAATTPASPPTADAPALADGAATPEGEPASSGTDLAAAGAATSSVADVSRTLGRGLAELRKAREEIQRTFRVDLDDAGGSPSRRSPSPRPAAEEPSPAPEAPSPAPEAAEPLEEAPPGPNAPPAD